MKPCPPSQVLAQLPAALAGDAPIGLVSDDPSPAELAVLNFDAPTAPDLAAVVTTSGSTGQPKAVELGAEALRAGAGATRELLGGFTWTCVLPTFYVAGLMVLVRGLLDAELGLGAGVVMASSDLSDLQPTPGRNAISVVPTQLVRALDNPAVSASLAGFDVVLVGGAALAPALLARAQACGINVVRTYGMSETCGGVVYDARALPGVRVDVDDDAQVHLTTPSAFSGYRGQPELTAAVLDGQTVHTSDRGHLDDDGRLRLLGRIDDVVISGGINVDLAGVQRVVNQIDEAAAVFAQPNRHWGEVVCLADPVGRTLAWWRAQLSAQLQPAALPKRVFCIAAPLTASGKVDRQQLRNMACNMAFDDQAGFGRRGVV